MSNCLKQYPQYREIVSKLNEENPDLLSLRARQLEAEDILKIAKHINKYSKK